MKPRGERADMARPALQRVRLALVALALSATSAFAGDRALLHIIGYSDNGRYFAFEEYGVQDGSGFPYSTIYVVDLSNDKWMYGSPFHAQQRDDQPDRPLADVRAEALQKAQEQLKPLKIGVPADIIALIGDGERDNDASTLHFGTPSWGLPGSTQQPSLTLKLETYQAAAGDTTCAAYSLEPVKGYALTLSGRDGEREVHRDKTVPKSRGCPLDYRLYAVVQPFEWAVTEGAIVAIISMYPHGFEGPDRRFLAVPLE